MDAIKLAVFLSFSGEKSHAIARELKQWLSSIFRGEIDFIVSFADTRKGAVWINDLNKRLRRSVAGILCVTRDNYKKPWLMFEAGALMAKCRPVIPFIVDENPDEISSFLRDTPLTIVQTTSYRVTPGEKLKDYAHVKVQENRDELLRTVLEINRVLKKRGYGYEESDLKDLLNGQYNSLARALQSIADDYPSESPNPQDIFTLVQDWLGNLSDEIERDKAATEEYKQGQRVLLEEALETVRSSEERFASAVEELKSHISEKGAVPDDQLNEIIECLERMESGFNRSIESRQRIAFGMGWIHERFPAVPSGLEVSSGVMTVDKKLSIYHVRAEARMAQIREEISSYLKGDTSFQVFERT